MFRSRSWFGSAWNRPKNRLSLEHLKYLYSILEKNTSVSENNRSLLVESLRCIAEILIWGDQHDSSVFDFFLEKNMLSYFLHIMRQKNGGSSFVCVQLLQTLNILFENIRNETSLYYLLSNNHVNSIVVHKFDFSDEDVMGYYILFLKTLSLKLNAHTIHFFYNEHTNDFPLYTEAIKFFNHPESMVRIAVRTISLNVYKVRNASMLQFIRNKTAAPYFSNLVWFIGKHILELDACLRSDVDHQSNQKLSNLVAEHLDHLHYLNDILLLEIHDLNGVLTEHLLHKLFVPLYIFSLTPTQPLSMAMVTQNLATVLNRVVDIDAQEVNNPRVSPIVALYLLSLVFLVITHGPLVHALAWVILNADNRVFTEGASEILNTYLDRREVVVPGFIEPLESLEQVLDTVTVSSTSTSIPESSYYNIEKYDSELSPPSDNVLQLQAITTNITDEEKEKLKKVSDFTSPDLLRPFLNVVLSYLDCTENDYLALLSLCLIYGMVNNRGVSKNWLEQVLSKSGSSTQTYRMQLVECLLSIICVSNQSSCRVRLVTLEISLDLLTMLTKPNTEDCCITESQQRALFMAQFQATTTLRNFYRSEEIFLDLFEDEYNELKKSQLNVEFLCMDSTILLPPTGTPLTGISFTRRLPCGEVEKARRAIREFFLLRRTCQIYSNEVEMVLPLTNTSNCVQINNVLDLNNSDLIACTVLSKDNSKQRRFLVIDSVQMILVEPDAKLLGWGIAKFVGFLQDVDVSGDKDDSRCLYITVHTGGASYNRLPTLSAKFLFDDHIRCMAAKQRLTKGRSKARQKKMYQIAQMLEIPRQTIDSPIYCVSETQLGIKFKGTREHSSTFLNANRVPGFAAALRKDNVPITSISRIHISNERSRRRTSSFNSSSMLTKNVSNKPSGGKMCPQSCEGSSSCLINDSSSRPRSEEIPLENIRHTPHNSLNSRSRSHTPGNRDQSDKVFALPTDDKNLTLTTQINGTIDTTERSVLCSEETSFISKDDVDKSSN